MQRSVEWYLTHYHTSLETGLSEEEARERLEHYGYNSIEAKKVTALDLALRIILSPVNLMILLAAILFYIVGEIFEFHFTLILFLINFFITFIQEYKSEKELEELRKKVEVDVEVKRDGKWKRIKAIFIVPGDIIRVKAGETVPADVVIVKGDNILVDESAVTGESIPKEKEVGDIVYASSVVRRGWLVGVVTATGKETKYGKVVYLVHTEKVRSNLERLIMNIGRILISIALVLTPIIFFYCLKIAKLPLYESIIYAASIFISFIPAALPAVASSIMVAVAYRLSKKNILIRRLSSIFDIGSMNMLCTDKTGTLTQNKMKLDKVVVLKGSEDEILLYAYASSDPESGDPIDCAIDRAVKARGLKPDYKVIEFVPYDSVRKFSYAVIEKDGKKLWVAKGSPEVLIKKIGAERPRVLDELYENGYRVLAVVRDNELVGFLAFYDPPLPDAKEFISDLKNLGIHVKMLTGDSLKVAVKIAKEVGIEGPAINRERLAEATDRHFDFLVRKYNIFAEIFPEDKYRIVSKLKEKGYIVGVTGDGINDIGAIKRADVGIAVYTATSATKSFSDIILTAPGLKQLVEAVERCREAIKRLENYVIYRIAEDLRFPFLITLFLFIYRNPILTPIQILILKVLNDIPILAIAFDKVEPFEKPTRIKLKISVPVSIVLGIVGVLNSLIFVLLLRYLGLPFFIISTFLFLKLVLTGHFLLYVVRTRKEFWFYNLPSKALFIPTFATQVAGTLVVLVDLLWKNETVYLWLIPLTWIYAFIWMNITDLVKVIMFRKTAISHEV